MGSVNSPSDIVEISPPNYIGNPNIIGGSQEDGENYVLSNDFDSVAIWMYTNS